MAKNKNCEISMDKQIYSKDQDAKSGISKEHKESTSKAAEPSPFAGVLEVLARNKPILDVLSVTCLILIIASIGVVVSLVFLFGKSSPQTSTVDNFTEDNSARIVTRIEWLAQPPRETLDLLQLPVQKVIIAHTATEGCTTKSQCVFMVSRIQRFHMAPDSKNFSDIAYNFLVGADGNIYEGRGWDKRGAHTKGFNKDSICVAFIGTFNDEAASEPQLRAARRLIAMGVEQGTIDPRYQLCGQRQLAPFSSPGEKLYQQIKVWPNWSSELGPRHWEDENKMI
ncbi:peptidoglycan-recognition protein SD [Culex quinquefasciatus]|uniref:peptidoglycan-recognition protein SD n=1 Tax=Culex quinquefasciatus TaxID=7176 RepID=UPI0018E3E846|nr:peptidoglycan-recognition protein SD [Culex quinquefasciatus]